MVAVVGPATGVDAGGARRDVRAVADLALVACACWRSTATREARRIVRAMLGSDLTNRPEGW